MVSIDLSSFDLSAFASKPFLESSFMITREAEGLGIEGADTDPIFTVDDNWNPKQSPVMRLRCIKEVPPKAVITCTIGGLVHTSAPECLPHPQVVVSVTNRFGCFCRPQRLPWAKFNAVLGQLEVVEVCGWCMCCVCGW